MTVLVISENGRRAIALCMAPLAAGHRCSLVLGHAGACLPRPAKAMRRDVCPACRGAGGWQQHDGLIVECPRGCMTDGGDQ